jgi:hypothetical protein
MPARTGRRPRISRPGGCTWHTRSPITKPLKPESKPLVTQATIGSTICIRGWTQTVRPSQQYTSALKRRQVREFGYAERKLGDYEEDHLIPLVLGGSPSDARNLWPEPWVSTDGWRADRKDELETVLARLVCAGRMPLADAQRAMATDWTAAYGRVRHRAAGLDVKAEAPGLTCGFCPNPQSHVAGRHDVPG